MEESKETNSWFGIFVILMHQACAFSMGATLTPLNSAAPAIAAFVNETYKISFACFVPSQQRYSSPSPEDRNKLIVVLSQSGLIWGSLVGALFVRMIVNNLSRKGAIALFHVFNICASIMMSPLARFAHSYEALIAGRTLGGISRCIGYVVVPVTVAETTCRRRLAFYQAPFMIMLYLGAAFGVGLGHAKAFGTATLWPLLIAFPAIPSVVLLCILPILPQTPAYHLKSNPRNRPAARATLRKLRRGDEAAIDNELAQIEAEIERDSKGHKATVVQLLKKTKYRKQMIAAFITMNCIQFTGLQAVDLYSDNLFREAGVAEEIVTFASFALLASSIVPGCIALLLIRRIGTKKTFLIGSGLTATGLIIFTLTTALKEASSAMPRASIAAMGLYFLGQYIGILPNLHAIPSELTTQTTRPAAIYLSGIGLWVIGSLVAFIFPYSLSAWGAFAYLPFVLCLTAGIAYVAFYVPDMHNKTIDQIQQGLSARTASLKASKRRTTVVSTTEGVENYAFEHTYFD